MIRSIASKRSISVLARPALRATARLAFRPVVASTASSAPRLYSSASAAKVVKLTSDTYPELERSSKFAKLTPEDVAYFKSVLPEGGVIEGEAATSTTADAELEPFNQDWMRKYRGQSRLVLRPTTTEQVSKIMKYCNEKVLAVVPQGGNTGLVGGSVPVFDEIVLSLVNINKVRSFDPLPAFSSPMLG